MLLVPLVSVLLSLPANAPKRITKPTVYVVGYSHLDTQWCWTLPQVIGEFIPKTLHDNFDLFEKYPTYVFNWTGSNRYRFMKEYYPEDYAKLKDWVAKGNWFPAGSSIEEGDVNAPSGESLIRQVLYGNEFFRREFGKASDEFMLPDCFGFPASLPTVLAHCGIKGFSTQKLTWGSAVGIPFNVGVWKGLDGSYVVAALNPGSYGSEIHRDPATDPGWIARVQRDEERSGVPVDYRYYGTGDTGGAPDEQSVRTVVEAVKTGGPLTIKAGPADEMFNDIAPDQVEKLPVYQGDLELTQHSAGSLTSEAEMKRWNRKNELLGDSAEKASVAADFVGALPYDKSRITDAWLRFLPGQFHDLMAGTALPTAYNYTWNDEILAMNEFADVITSAVGGVSRGLDTRGDGIPLAVYNPLSIDRDDVVEAAIPLGGGPYEAAGPDGRTTPLQVVSRSKGMAKVLFLARVPSVGFATYHIRRGRAPGGDDLKVGRGFLENARYRVTLNGAGEVASIFDKSLNKETLRGPIRLAFQHENPRDYPAWNMDWSDQRQPPRGYVTGPASVKIVENGPVRVALQVTRHTDGSTFVETVRLGSGDAQNRVEYSDVIDWRGKECALKATIPLTASNPEATYNWGPGTIQRGNDDPKKYEVASHQWFDLTDQSGKFGMTVLDDNKQGSDKPDDSTLRLTLLYTPGVAGGYQHQGTQDWGRQTMLFGLMSHAGDWRVGGSQWQAASMNQPLVAFQTTAHPGLSGKDLSFARVSSPDVEVGALKQVEDGNDLIIRLNELNGTSAEAVHIHFPRPVVYATEVDGQERQIGPATVEDGDLVVDMTPYHPRAFKLSLNQMSTSYPSVGPPKSTPIDLPFDLDATSPGPHVTDGKFDADGRSIPGDLLPSEIVSDGINFKFGASSEGSKNALTCSGQTIEAPAGHDRTLYVLAASDDGDTIGDFRVGGKTVPVPVQQWNGFIGQWDNRLWGGVVPREAYDWHNPLVGLQPGFIKRDPVAWYADHRRMADGSDGIYQFCYLFRYGIELPDGAQSVTLPNNPRIRIMAATVGEDTNDGARPTSPLYDVLERGGTAGPTVSPDGGEYHDSVRVELGHAFYWTPKDLLRYTLDGSNPSADSPAYTGPFFVRKNEMVKVADIGPNGTVGPVTTASFRVNDTTPPSVLDASAIAGSNVVRVRLSEPVVPGDAIQTTHYTVSPADLAQSATVSPDGTDITLMLTSPLSSDSTIRVAGLRDLSPNRNPSDANATIRVATPVITEEGKPGTYADVGLPTKADSPWTINFFAYMDHEPEDLSLLAGFGSGRDTAGEQRYIIEHNGHAYFWGSGIDIESNEPYDLNRWQMVTATFDGTTLRLYKDGKEIAHDTAQFGDARPLVKIAPTPAWRYGHRYDGKIAGLTIWSRALLPEELKELEKRFSASGQPSRKRS